MSELEDIGSLSGAVAAVPPLPDGAVMRRRLERIR